MSSIQILELRPLEAQIEDLSDNMTGIIRGGADPVECVGFFLRDLGRLLGDEVFSPDLFLQLVGDFLLCTLNV